jgi:hypothetical protein
MKQRRFFRVQTIGTILFALSLSASDVMALERWLVPDTSQCADDTTINPCHLSLDDAVTQAAGGDSIKILPGTYPANVILSPAKNITIYGVETARTFLTGNSGAAITVNGVTAAMGIRNITFINASPAIQVSNGSSQVGIRNNIFEVAGSATAISVTDALSSPVIANNTFFGNGIAILSLSQPNLSIINNIFYGNGIAISTNVAANNILSNLFWQNSTIGNPTIILNSPGDPNYKWNVSVQDPQIINVSDNDLKKRDFHLKSTTTTTIAKGDTTAGPNSINSISPPDMGAYGGPLSDTIPFPVSGLSGIISGSSIDLTWSSNPCYMIQGYKVFYSANKSGDPYDSTQDAGNVTSFTLGPLTAPTSTMTAPVLSSVPGNGILALAWTPSSGATGYNIYYKESSAAVYNPPIQVGNTNTFDLSGLTNPTPGGVVTYYDVYVQPYYQAAYHIAVKPYYNTTDASKLALVYSNELSVPFGTPIDGPVSNTITDFPEPITAVPALPNKGCFIATAAYGSYSASQVQALREFRDQYLLTNGPGRVFVRWYYTYGPRGAQILNDHPEWKPIVRAAMLPAVGVAMFLTHTSPLIKSMALIIGLSLVLLLVRNKLTLSGGIQ